MPDDDGYPTRAELRQIRTYAVLPREAGEAPRFLEYMELVRGAWWSPEWGWRANHKRERKRGGGLLHRRYRISTGGWSGNEDIIEAMMANTMFWAICWERSERGGHYAFLVPEP